ncbi:hypothetical protein C2S53_001909 [Perilla frutescens var. hirtella]|uniref:Uncharacterized protein n=1 Tax=Perilla frutescens var. hirtella TaxID=608512 RepID=A0AAD4P3K1_PERFH|nr:hypothetical protein C2S53_001909 [Perilla frutescens var. hirtella]
MNYMEYLDNCSFLNDTHRDGFKKCRDEIDQKKLDSPIAWIGMYVAAASAVCLVAMAADAFNGFRSKKLWIPLGEEIGCGVAMLVLLVTLCSSAVMVPTAKRYIESTYNEMHKNISEKQVEWGEFSGDELGRKVKRYWVMAASGSPQFVLARSSISGTSALICLLMLLTLVEAYVRIHKENAWYDADLKNSNYKWSIDWILVTQTTGVVLGIVAPLLRWFLAARFKISKIGRKRLRDEFKIEKFWTSLLVGWRDKSLPSQIKHRQCRKLLHAAKVLLLNICIGVQVLIVLASKLNLLISAKLVNAVCLCFYFCFCIKRPDEIPEAEDGKELNYSDYVILLEGEAQLPVKIMKNLCSEVDKLIQTGEKKQHKNLIRLLKKSANFHGLGQFDSDKVQSLHSQEPPNCWSLPLATLMSISIALTNIAANKITDQLLAVSEGMSLVMLIEKTLDRNGELESIRQAADLVWNELELNRKWGGKDLQSTSVRGRTNKETLRKLSDVAEKIVTDYTTQKKDDLLMQNPLNWDVKIIAANSMYRITQTILLRNKDGKHQTDDELFESLSIIISNILLACFTNLVQVITFKCHKNAIEERVESVRQAAILLGESKEILEILQQRRQLLPSLDPEKAANIDEWRAAFMAEDIENPSAFVSEPNEEQASAEIVV